MCDARSFGPSLAPPDAAPSAAALATKHTPKAIRLYRRADAGPNRFAGDVCRRRIQGCKVRVGFLPQFRRSDFESCENRRDLWGEEPNFRDAAIHHESR